MVAATDRRIPISFGGGPADAVYLVEGSRPAPAGAHAASFTLPAAGHPAGCGCCQPRGPAMAALTSLYRARAVGAAPFFRHVVVLASPAGEAAVREAVAADVVVGARYRL